MNPSDFYKFQQLALTPRYGKNRNQLIAGMAGMQKHFSCGAFPTGGSNTGNQTFQNQIPARYPFSGFEVVYVNGTGTAATLTTCFGASPSADGVDGSALTWTQITFAGANSVVLPVITGTEPNAIRTYVRSDFVAIPCANAALPLAMVRSYFAGTNSCAENPAAGELAAFRTTAGLNYKTGFSAGAVLGTAGITMTEGQLIVPAGILWTYDAPAITVAAIGGSTFRGQGSSGNATGMIQRACQALSSASKIYTPFIGAFSGQGSAATLQNAAQVIAAVRPDILFFQVGSGNNTDLTQNGFEIMRGQVGAIVDLCRRNGVQPALTTLGPANSLTAPQDASRKLQNIWAKSFAQYLPVCDIAPWMEDPNDSSKMNPAFDSGDGTHMNDAGQAYVAAQAVAPSISQIF